MRAPLLDLCKSSEQVAAFRKPRVVLRKAQQAGSTYGRQGAELHCAATMPAACSIFISYRRSDLSLEAEWLHALIETFFGVDIAFLDGREIEGGTRWDDTLEHGVRQARLVLVLIGPVWLNARLPSGVHCLDDPEDRVRREVAALWWQRLLERHPAALQTPDTRDAVHTALLSLTFNLGYFGRLWSRLGPLIGARKWARLGDATDQLLLPEAAAAVRPRRRQEAAPIRAALAGGSGSGRG